MLGQLQGQDHIVVDAPVEHLWPLVADSRHLAWWGPPVRRVDIMEAPDGVEGLGSRRRVHAEFRMRRGWFVEVRREFDPPRRVAWEIVEDSFGTLAVTRNTGAALELERRGPRRTRVSFLFHHDPRGLGRLLNRPVLLPEMRRNRTMALVSLKKHAEFTWRHGLRADASGPGQEPLAFDVDDPEPVRWA